MSSPRTTPSRTGRRPLPSRITRTAMKGSRNSATKFGCPLACEIIAGAKPQMAPPTAAANRDRTRCRCSTQYQAMAVPARPAVRARVNVAAGPNSSVIGASGMLTPNIAVFPIRLTPSGAFCRSLLSGFCRCTSEWAATAKNHSHIVWSWPLTERYPVPRAFHCRSRTTQASATKIVTTARSASSPGPGARSGHRDRSRPGASSRRDVRFGRVAVSVDRPLVAGASVSGTQSRLLWCGATREHAAGKRRSRRRYPRLFAHPVTAGLGSMLRMPGATAVGDALRKAHICDILDDGTTRAAFSSDASLYRVRPQAVVRPRSVDEVAATLDVCRTLGVPVTSRGAGTSAAGNAVGSGVILDFSRHLNRVLAVDPGTRTATVQPGTVQAVLQRAAAPHGLRFGPDPSTHNRCTIGGMIGNNACGARTLGYGRTSDNVEALTVITGAGEVLDLAAGARPEAVRPAGGPPAGGQPAVLERLHALTGSGLATIRTEFGRFGRQASGYALDHLL